MSRSLVFVLLYVFAFSVQKVRSQTLDTECVVAIESLFNSTQCQSLFTSFDPLLCQICQAPVQEVLEDCEGDSITPVS